LRCFVSTIFKPSVTSLWLGLLCLQVFSLFPNAYAESAFKPFGPSNSSSQTTQQYNLPNTGFYQQNNTYYNPYGQQTVIIRNSCSQPLGHVFNAQGLSVPQRTGSAPALPTWGVGSTGGGNAVPNRTVGGPAQLRR
jgi:hypothetical protein